MADTKISGLTAVGTLHQDDLLMDVDVHDTTMASTGTNKKLTISQLFGSPSAGNLLGWEGIPTPIVLGSGLSLTGSGPFTLSATGGGGGSGTVSSGVTGELAFYATSGTTVTGLTLGTGLSLSGATLNATGGSGSGSVGSGTLGQVAYYAAAGTTVSGVSGFEVSANGNLLLPATTTPGSPVAGEVYRVATGVAANIGGVERVGGGTVARILSAGGAVSNTTTTTSLLAGATVAGTMTIPANAFVAGARLKLVTWGVYTGNATISMGFRGLVIGGTSSTVLARLINASGLAGIVPPANTSLRWLADIDLVCLTTGTSGTFDAAGNLTLVDNSGTSGSSTDMVASIAPSGGSTSVLTFDTTSSQTLDQQFAWTSASSAVSWQLLGGYLTWS